MLKKLLKYLHLDNQQNDIVDFIPAQESPFFIRFFRIYVKWLFKRRFNHIWIHQKYTPSLNQQTVYFLNHTSWWDGLIPFLLNEYKFHQHARAIMEHDQMKTYPFFKWLGAFSIKPEDTVHTRKSLQYAVDSMQRKSSSLFIYPEGEINPASPKINIKPGIGWLYTQLPNVDFVPVGIQIHTIRHDKPELHVWIGKPIQADSGHDRDRIITICESRINTILDRLLETAGFNNEPYTLFF